MDEFIVPFQNVLISFNPILRPKFATGNLNWNSLNVQELWNVLENVIVHCVDQIVPMSNVVSNLNCKNQKIPSHVKSKINKRKRLLHIDKIRNSMSHNASVKQLNLEIKSFFANRRAERVRNAATGSNGNIWNAVKTAKNVNVNAIPSRLTLGGVPIVGCAAQLFGKYFHDKIKTNFANTNIKWNDTYNGKNKLIVQNRNFMTPNDVKICLNDLGSKKCEGFDRIPVCVLFDSRAALLPPLSVLFNKIYKTPC